MAEENIHDRDARIRREQLEREAAEKAEADKRAPAPSKQSSATPGIPPAPSVPEL